MNSQLTLYPMCGFIAQLLEHRPGNADVMGSYHVEGLNYFQASLAQLRGSFLHFSLLHPQFIYDFIRCNRFVFLLYLGTKIWNQEPHQWEQKVCAFRLTSQWRLPLTQSACTHSAAMQPSFTRCLAEVIRTTPVAEQINVSLLSCKSNANVISMSLCPS